MLQLITIALLALAGLSSVSNAAPTGMSSLMNSNPVAVIPSDTVIPMHWRRDHTQVHQDIYSDAILKSALTQVMSSHQMITKRDISNEDLNTIFRSVFDMIIDNLIKMNPSAADAVTVNKDTLFSIFLNEINQLILNTVSGKEATGSPSQAPSRVIMQRLAHTNATDADDTKYEYVPAAAIEHDGEKEVEDDATKWFSVFKKAAEEAAAKEYDTEKEITDEAVTITKEYSDEDKESNNGATTKAISDLKKVFDDAATGEYEDTKKVVDEIDTKEFEVEDSEDAYTKEEFDSEEYVTDAEEYENGEEVIDAKVYESEEKVVDDKEYDSDASAKDKKVTGGAVTTNSKSDKKVTDKKVTSKDKHNEDEQVEEITKDEDGEVVENEDEEEKIVEDEDEEEEYQVKDNEYEQDEYENEQDEEVEVKEEVGEYEHEHEKHDHQAEKYEHELEKVQYY